MGHLDFSGYTFNALYCHFVILNSFFFVIVMIIYSQAAQLRNLTMHRYPIILIDVFLDFKLYKIIHCHFFSLTWISFM